MSFHKYTNLSSHVSFSSPSNNNYFPHLFPYLLLIWLFDYQFVVI